MACSRPPRNHTQLDSGEPTRSFDCGVEKTRDAIDFASCGKVDVSVPKLRELMAKPGSVPTNPRDWKTAIESDFVAAKFRAKGLRPPKVRLLDGVGIAIAEQDLAAGRFLIAAIWYATINALAPHKSASRTFGDNHAVGVFDPQGGIDKWNDPLADGRPDPAGGRYPKGTQRIRWEVVRHAAANVRIRTRDAAGRIVTERKLGAGLFLGISVPRSKPLDGTPPVDPDPGPDIDYPAELAKLADQIETANGDIDLANSSLDLAQATLDDASARIEELLAEQEGS